MEKRSLLFGMAVALTGLLLQPFISAQYGLLISAFAGAVFIILGIAIAARA